MNSQSHIFNPSRFRGRTIYIFAPFKGLFVCLDVFPYLSYRQFYLPVVSVYSMGICHFSSKNNPADNISESISPTQGSKKYQLRLIFVQMSISDVLCGIFVSSFLSCQTSWRNCRWRQSSNWPIPIHCELFATVQETSSSNISNTHIREMQVSVLHGGGHACGGALISDRF